MMIGCGWLIAGARIVGTWHVFHYWLWWYRFWVHGRSLEGPVGLDVIRCDPVCVLSLGGVAHGAMTTLEITTKQLQHKLNSTLQTYVISLQEMHHHHCLEPLTKIF